MKNSLFACLILFFSLSFSQDLFVDTGSYVFVDGTAFTSAPTVAPLYVTNDIELAGNGNIYLRNEAQLLQGAGTITSTNTGEGQLSVYQTGNSNTYMYNYWCSPVGLNTGAAGNTDFRPNNALYGETAAPITSALATYVSAPNYDGVASSPPVIADFWFYSFIGVSPPATAYDDWVPLSSNAGNLDSGYGFTMKGNPSGAQKYDFRGRPNNGTITATVNPNVETLVGNPYPSVLDAYYFLNDPLNIVSTSGVIKYWEQAPGASSHLLSSYVGGYANYTITTDNDGGTPMDLTDDTVIESSVPATFFMYLLDGNPASGLPITNANMRIAGRYIPIGQGFMVEGNGSGGLITFRNSQRAFYKQSGANSVFFRTSTTESSSNEFYEENQYTDEGYNIVPPSVKRFRINVGFDNNGNDSYTRQLLMNFHHRATDGFDYGFEAKGGGNLDSDAYWVLDNNPFVIQAFQYNETLKIPMVVKVANQQLNRFSILDVQNFDDGQPIYLHDKEKDIYVNLQDEAYEIVLENGTYTNRFEIVFTSEVALDVDEFDMDTVTINQNNGIHQLTVLNPKNLNISAIEVYDITGKRLLHDTFDTILNRYEFSTTDLSDGVYIVNVQAQTSVARSQKILVKN